MDIDSARVAVNEALDKALAGKTIEVSPTIHEISTVQLLEIADEEIARRGGGFATEWRENGSLVFRVMTSL